MTPTSIIEKKRDRHELSTEELEFFLRGIDKGDVTDYQVTALLMAIYLNGMTLRETVDLTRLMLESGKRYSLASIDGPLVDKHSTGGIGDKVSLILAPLGAACGLKIPMMSGRGLGFSGGTLDKLESIPGFDVNLEEAQFEKTIAKLGFAMIGQSAAIAPLDKKLYALRDVTGTVECIPLITASILSKKLAEGATSLVLDVKVGSGAFMSSVPRARRLAKTLVKVGKQLGIEVRALLTDMNQPLGYSVGNALEVLESIEVLKGELTETRLTELPETCGSSDLKELCIQLTAQMLVVSGAKRSLSEARKLAHLRLRDGSAWELFCKSIKAQNGNLSTVMHPQKLPLADHVSTWNARRSGYLSSMQASEVGKLLIDLGGGRKKASDSIDPGVGFVFHQKLGSRLEEGTPLVSVFHRNPASLSELEHRFHKALKYSSTRKRLQKLVVDALVK